MSAADPFLAHPHYDSGAVDEACYEQWESNGCFTPQGAGEPYCVMIPPPNVTGTLHMGHAFQNTLIDILVRYARMKGRQTLWQVGTDHAGIATQIVVERQLEQENLSRHALGRDAFVERVWTWKAQSGGTIVQQLRRLGVSADWSRERFTLDPGLQEAVQTAFVRLFRDGLIERRQRLVAWDPILQTALSDLEVTTEERTGYLYEVYYPLESDASQGLVVATTRPETLFGDEAVAVHPDDPRYASWIGRRLRLPLTDRTIPIIADAHVDPEFGTGCLKITPAHDPHDYQIGLRHGLALRNILHPNGTLNAQVPLPFQNMDTLTARAAVVQALREQGFWRKTVAHVQQVPISEKNGTVLEPYLTEQWYLKMQDMADKALCAAQEGQLEFIPAAWRNTYTVWLENIQDWCISRQLWWGHRIPVWTDAHGRHYAGMSEDDVRSYYALPADCVLQQDTDVLDTWFSSALWPFSTLGWPHTTPEFSRFYPTQILVTGFDIIFFWVARMVMFALYFTGKVPFKTVYIHGLVCDQSGQKMSKSRGNVLDPIDLIDGISLEKLLEKRTQNLMHPHKAPQIAEATRKAFPDGIRAYGVDPVRFTFAALATHARKINFDVARLEGYRNFCNKIWNAARFLCTKLRPQDTAVLPAPTWMGASRWEKALWTRLRHAVTESEQALAHCRFDHYTQTVQDLVWGVYCDWAIEIVKIRSQSVAEGTEAAIQMAAHMWHVFSHLLRVMHPVMPFITERLWPLVRTYTALPETRLIDAAFPDTAALPADDAACEEVTWLEGWVQAIRAVRSTAGIAPHAVLPMWYRCTEAALHDPGGRWMRVLQEETPVVTALCRLQAVHCVPMGEALPVENRLQGYYAGWEFSLEMPAGWQEQERHRLQKALQKNQDAWGLVKKKLENPQFVARAPAELVAAERERATLLEAEAQQLQAHLDRLQIP